MKIVFALGGNALGNNPEEQAKLAFEVALPILDLIQQGHQVVLVHGNGPQVGMIKTSLDYAHQHLEKIPFVNLNHAGAMSQGYIGYALQHAFYNASIVKNIPIKPVTVITQVEVDEQDAAFQHPTKPIGGFYTEEQAKVLEKQGFAMVEDAGRGYRQVVASPQPISMMEKDAILDLIRLGYTVIASGGGGIPVAKKKKTLSGVDAVIDKDFAASKLASLLDADRLILLTGVANVLIHYGKPNQRKLETVKTDELQTYIEEGHFAPGSMLPKVLAAKAFVQGHPDRVAIIGALTDASAIVEGRAGTQIID